MTKIFQFEILNSVMSQMKIIFTKLKYMRIKQEYYLIVYN